MRITLKNFDAVKKKFSETLAKPEFVSKEQIQLIERMNEVAIEANYVRAIDRKIWGL